MVKKCLDQHTGLQSGLDPAKNCALEEDALSKMPLCARQIANIRLFFFSGPGVPKRKTCIFSKVRKVAEPKVPRVLRFFVPNFAQKFPRIFEKFWALFPLKRRSPKIHQKSPPVFAAVFFAGSRSFRGLWCWRNFWMLPIPIQRSLSSCSSCRDLAWNR